MTSNTDNNNNNNSSSSASSASASSHHHHQHPRGGGGGGGGRGGGGSGSRRGGGRGAHQHSLSKNASNRSMQHSTQQHQQPSSSSSSSTTQANKSHQQQQQQQPHHPHQQHTIRKYSTGGNQRYHNNQNHNNNNIESQLKHRLNELIMACYPNLLSSDHHIKDMIVAKLYALITSSKIAHTVPTHRDIFDRLRAVEQFLFEKRPSVEKRDKIQFWNLIQQVIYQTHHSSKRQSIEYASSSSSSSESNDADDDDDSYEDIDSDEEDDDEEENSDDASSEGEIKPSPRQKQPQQSAVVPAAAQVNNAISNTSRDQIEGVINNLRILESSLRNKDEQLTEIIQTCSKQKQEIQNEIDRLHVEVNHFVTMLSSIQAGSPPASTAAITAGQSSLPTTRVSPRQITAPQTSAQQQAQQPQQPQQQQQQRQLPARRDSSAQQEQQQPQQQQESPPRMSKEEIENIKKQMVMSLNELKYADAARFASMIPINEVPMQALIDLYKGLENPEFLPPSAIDNILKLMSASISSNIAVEENLVLQRNLVLHYAKRMTIRRYELIVSILSKIYQYNRLPLNKVLPNTAAKAAKQARFRSYMKYQTLIATLLVGNPRESIKLLRCYRPVLDQLLSEVQLVSYVLHETSLEALRSNDGATTTTPALPIVEELGTSDDSVDNSSSSSSNNNNNGSTPAIQEETADNDDDDSGDDTNQQEFKRTTLPTISDATAQSLTKEANEIFVSLAPDAVETAQKQELINELSVLCGVIFPKAELHPYGSSATNLGIKGSDIDLCIKLETDIHSDTNLQMQLLNVLYKAITSTPQMKHLSSAEQPVIRSRVPILQVKDNKRNLECDICISNFLGVANSRMLRMYAEFDPRVRPLIYVIKQWTKARHINDPPSGSLSSYSYVLMVIHFLQTLETPILPCLQALINHPDVTPDDISQPHYVNAYDCRYVANMSKVRQLFTDNERNNMSLGQLVAGFFTYFNTIYDFNHKSMSVRLGRTIDKKISGIYFSIEDPFERRDLGSVVSDTMVPKMAGEFKRAYNILSSGGCIADIMEERATETDEVNIYNVKQNYEDHIDAEVALQLIQEGKLHKGVLRVNKIRFKEAYVTVEGFPRDILVDGFKPRNRALHGDVVALKITYERKLKIDMSSDHSTDNKQQVHGIEPVDSEYTVTGTVVCILEQNSPTYFACTVMKQDDEQNKGFRWLLPIEKCYPKIMVQFEEFKHVFNAKAMDLEEVIMIGEINRPWNKSRHYPKGKIAGVLGLKRDLWSQKRAILLQQMPTLFDNVLSNKKEKRAKENNAIAYVDGAAISSETKKAENLSEKRESWDINNIEIDIEQEIANGYVDWRNRRVFTIDPSTSRDLDDALSIEHVEGEWYNVTVYVADVTRFVKEGDETDLEARKRATSVYLIDTVDHMLDPSLSQNLCSLLPGVTRFSVAVEFWMNKKGEIRKDTIHFRRCIICSVCRLDYDSVQDTLEGRPIPEDKRKVLPGFHWKDIHDDLFVLNEMAQSLRKKRYAHGSVELSNEELYFGLDEDGYPISVSKAQHTESHQLIEEYALLANQLTATALHDYYGPNCLLRQHSPPGAEGWASTVIQMTYAISKMVQYVGDIPASQHPMMTEITTMLKEKKSTQEVMNKLQSYTKNYPFMEQAVRHALLREMQLAKYVREGDCDEKELRTHHFALNMDLYTHFTSPIRRYADIIVHRQLLQMIAEKNQNITRPIPSIHGQELSEIIANVNEQAYHASLAQDQCQKQYLAYYLMPRVAQKVERVEAVVMSLGRRSFTVYVPDYCVEIKCNVMKQFSPAPQSMQEVEQMEGIGLMSESGEGDEGREGVTIDCLTLTWSDPNCLSNTTTGERTKSDQMRYEALNRCLELKPLMRVLVDLDVNYDTIPCDVFVYNVWEFDQQLVEKSGSTLPLRNRAAANQPAVSSSPVNPSFLREQQKHEKQEKQQKRQAAINKKKNFAAFGNQKKEHHGKDRENGGSSNNANNYRNRRKNSNPTKPDNNNRSQQS